MPVSATPSGGDGLPREKLLNCIAPSNRDIVNGPVVSISALLAPITSSSVSCCIGRLALLYVYTGSGAGNLVDPDQPGQADP